jgi:hypothetical protein
MKNLAVLTGIKFSGKTGFNDIKSIAYSIGYYLIAGVLLFSGVSKIIDPWPLIDTLKLVANMPEEYLIAISAVLPIIEIGLGILLILKIRPKPVLLATLVLFAAFFLFSIYGTMVGLKNDCGCFGSLVKSEIGWGMVGRNLSFLILGIAITINFKNKRIE